jgi:excisionase family DNA binding protein
MDSGACRPVALQRAGKTAILQGLGARSSEPLKLGEVPGEPGGHVMQEYLSTTEIGWLLGRSPNAVRQMIREGEIEGIRMASGFRIPRDEALRLSRERIESEAGSKLSDAKLERLIDEVISTNQAQLEANPG